MNASRAMAFGTVVLTVMLLVLTVVSVMTLSAGIVESDRQAALLMGGLGFGFLVLGTSLGVLTVRVLRRSEAAFARREHLLDQHVLIAFLDRDGVVTEASNALCRFLGVPREAVVGTRTWFFDMSPLEDSKAREILMTVSTGAPWTGEVERVDLDKGSRWATMTVLPTFDDAYTLVGYTAILSETTDHRLSVTDSLTGLLNRRRLEEIAEREMRAAARRREPVTLAIIDIDFFGRYNDRYGRPAGDKALARVGQVIQSRARRPDDFAFRIGGEEFAMLFSGHDENGTNALLAEIHEAIGGLGIVRDDLERTDHLTVSVGAKVLHPEERMPSLEEFHEAAETALSEAKLRRDAVVVS